MTSLQSLRTRLRPLALVVGIGWAFTSTGCYSWRAAPAVPLPNGLAHQPVRVTLRSGQVLKLDDASVTGDSLTWSEERAFSFARRTIPVTEIQKLEVRRIDAGRTAAAVVGVALVTAVVVAVVKRAFERWDWGMGNFPLGY
jgi:hypothetical protein